MFIFESLNLFAEAMVVTSENGNLLASLKKPDCKKYTADFSNVPRPCPMARAFGVYILVLRRVEYFHFNFLPNVKYESDEWILFLGRISG